MLAKTSDVLSRASVGSSAQLEQRLYDELGDATMADVMNHAIGIFANAPKCILVISTRGISSEWETKKEEEGILFNDRGKLGVPIGNFRYPKMISGNPLFFKTGDYERSHTFTKTLLGEMVGDIFAVQGVYAGADPRFGEPLARILKPSGHTGDLDIHLLSLLIMEWANDNRSNPTLSRFIKETKLLHEDSTQKERTHEYHRISKRVNNVAKLLSQEGFVIYHSRGPGDRNIYTSVNNTPLSVGPPYGISMDVAVLVSDELLKNKASAQEIAATICYNSSYVRRILNWFVDSGYAKMNYGKPRERSLPIKPTRKSRRLYGYVDQPMTLLGFYPKKNGIGSIWEHPKINVAGLVRYREELIDTLYDNADKRAAFEEACRIAYRRYIAQFGRRETTCS